MAPSRAWVLAAWAAGRGGDAIASTVAERYRRVGGRFAEIVGQVEPAGWDRRAPCEGWAARDVVGHLVEWVPAFFSAAGGPPMAGGPSAHDDPAAAWAALHAAILALLDDPAASSAPISHPRAGAHRFDEAIDTFVTPDVLVHSWDLARSAGLDDTLDAELVHDLLVRMEPLDEALRASGQFGPRIDVPAGADEQTRLIAFTGRQP